MKPVYILFKCCNSVAEFTQLREFKQCTCGKSFYDAGDGFYSRAGGKLEQLSKEAFLAELIFGSTEVVSELSP